jgi:hypothetical protein
VADWGGALRRHLKLLLLVPLLAGGITAGVLSRIVPQQYRSTATVSVPDMAAAGARDTTQAVANFEGAATTDAIVEKVAKSSGLGAHVVKAGASTKRVGSSGIVQVSFTSDRKAVAPKVASNLARETLLFLFQTRVDSSTADRTRAQAEVAALDKQVDGIIDRVGAAEPLEYYRLRQSELSSLRLRLEDVVAAGGRGATEIQSAITSRSLELIALRPQIVEYSRLEDQRTQALTALQDAESAYRTANDQFGDGAADSAISVPAQATAVGRLSGVVRAAGGAAILGLLIAAAMALYLELSRRPAAEAAAAEATDEPDVDLRTAGFRSGRVAEPGQARGQQRIKPAEARHVEVPSVGIGSAGVEAVPRQPAFEAGVAADADEVQDPR